MKVYEIKIICSCWVEWEAIHEAIFICTNYYKQYIQKLYFFIQFITLRPPSNSVAMFNF